MPERPVMEDVRKYQSWRTENGISSEENNAISVEKPFKILINQQPFTVTMRTPGMEKELALGLLYNEDVIRSTENLKWQLKLDQVMDEISIECPEENLKSGYMNARNFLSVSSCGVCGKTSLPEIDGKLTFSNPFDEGIISEGFSAMKNHQDNFRQTGGCHAAAILDRAGNIIAFGEDIGRHNAVDKVIGQLLIKKQLSEGFLLLVSGRISYEIIIKCFRAKIPVLAAVSAPSSLAIDYAKELGVQLYGFCRESRMTRFA